MRILKLILFVILLCLLSSIGYSQSTFFFGATTRTTDTSRTKGILKLDAYANSNTSLFLTVNAQGRVVFAVPAGGGGSVDSTIFATIYRDDTGKVRLTAAINAKENPLTFVAPLSRAVNSISIPQASALEDGYLDNADFLAFSQKQNQVSLTTTGTSGAATFNPSTGDLNIPVYAGQTYLAGVGIGLTGNTFYLDTTVAATQSDIAGFGTGSVTNVSTGFGMLGGPITTVGTVRVDSFAIATRLRLQKVADSIAALDAGGTVTSVGVVAGTGVSIAGTSPITSAGTFTVTNTAPDQTVTLNAGTGISIGGSYPTFTVTNTASSVGTVTTVSVVSANGFAGSVADPTTTPAITLSTTVNGLVKGNGTALLPAVAGTDYLTPSGASAVYVPYTGATSNVNLGTFNLAVDTVAATGVVSIYTDGVTPIALTNARLDIQGSADNYMQANIRNASSGTMASSDWIATCNDGTDATRFIDVGINGSGFSNPAWTINGARDGYLYTQSDDLAVGTASNSDLVLFTGGLLAANERVKITGAGTMSVSATSTFNNDITVNTVNIGRGGANVNSNTRVGEGALANNSVSGGGVNGTRNTALGDGSLAANTTGSTNTGVGSAALEDVTTGTGNTAVGDRALGVTTGTGITGNTAVGLLSQGSATGSSNTTVGWQSATAGTFSASFVTAIGALSGQSLTSGAANTLVGYNSGNAITTGTSNICYGPNAGSLITTGSFNVCVGSFTMTGFTTTSNGIWLSDGQTNVRVRIPSTGNMLLGTTTDDGTNRMQISGSLAVSSGPTGLYTDERLTRNAATGQYRSINTTATITGTGNQTHSVETNALLIVVVIAPVSTETIRIGTTNGGQELAADAVYTAGTTTTVVINRVLSLSGATTIFINGATVGSVTYLIKKS